MRGRYIVALAVLTAGAFICPAAGSRPRLDSWAQNARGRYLVIVGDCAACHTTEWGEPFAGDKPVPTPFGTVYSANITPDEETGIGAWTDAEFLRAMRHGISADGSRLYPAFPYPWFTRVTREDLLAIRAYLDTLEPVHSVERENELAWPMSWRFLVSGWNLLYLDSGAFEPDPELTAEQNRGAYLVQGPGHCGACHTPKSWMGGPQRDQAYAGNALQNWFAAKLDGDETSGLGAWSEQDIVEYLRTGSNGFAFAGGLMQEVVEKSTSRMRQSDLEAIAAYLKTLPPGEDTGGDGDDTAVAAAEQFPEGHRVYVDNCIGCHGYEGEGLPDVFPPLDGRATVLSPNATSLIHAVLRGISEASTEARPTRIRMPGFAWKLSDEQVAAVVNYVRNAWGNHASTVDASAVAEIREATSAG
ncbi:MAG TPA: cytochrome c [Woeseiaceae bacterium]|nr:cytochrome c [Woeseiaceae bacterium]